MFVLEYLPVEGFNRNKFWEIFGFSAQLDKATWAPKLHPIEIKIVLAISNTYLLVKTNQR